MINAKYPNRVKSTRFFGGVAPTEDDDAFDKHLAEATRAQKKLEWATMICIRSTAKILLNALSMFGGPEADYLTKRFQETLETGGHVATLGVAANVFLSDTRKSVDLGGDSPEANLINAVRCLQDAIDDLGAARYVDAHANSVRCRSSLQKILG